MSKKKFISARIPQDLLEKIEEYAERKGESKSQILIEAIEKYLDPQELNTEEKLTLEGIKKFDNWIEYRLENLEKKVSSLAQIEKILSLKDKNDLIEIIRKMDCEKSISSLPKNIDYPCLPSSTESKETESKEIVGNSKKNLRN